MNLHLETIPPPALSQRWGEPDHGAENAALMEKMKVVARLHSLMGADSVPMLHAWDNPQTTQPEDCRYDVCLVLPQGLLPPDGDMTLGRIAGNDTPSPSFPIPEGVAKAGTSSSRPLSKGSSPTHPALF